MQWVGVSLLVGHALPNRGFLGADPTKGLAIAGQLHVVWDQPIEALVTRPPAEGGKQFSVFGASRRHFNSVVMARTFSATLWVDACRSFGAPRRISHWI